MLEAESTRRDIRQQSNEEMAETGGHLSRRFRALERLAERKAEALTQAERDALQGSIDALTAETSNEIADVGMMPDWARAARPTKGR